MLFSCDNGTGMNNLECIDLQLVALAGKEKYYSDNQFLNISISRKYIIIKKQYGSFLDSQTY